MNGEIITEVTFEEFFIEVHHARGNFSKFQVIDDPSEPHSEWIDADVWRFRRETDEGWKQGYLLHGNVERAAEKAHLELPHKLLRVIRYPDLEKDVLDTTYHPSVELWRIDPDKVKEFFNE